MLTRPDYCIAAFAIILSISIIQWFIDGRKTFTGPRVNLEGYIVEPAPEEDSKDEGHVEHST